MAWLLAALLGWGLVLGACGDDGGDADAVGTGDPDSGDGEDSGIADGGDEPPEEMDANFPLPMPRPDSGVEPGDPPPELTDQACAVDTNKLYDLAIGDDPTPTQLAVDPLDSVFGLTYSGKSESCIDALYFAELVGASGAGEPEVETVLDECNEIARAAVAHTGERWLLAAVDNRAAYRDLWVQQYDGEETYDAFQITETPGRESEVVMVKVGDEAMLVAWTEDDLETGEHLLAARTLSLDGEPTSEVIVLEQSDTVSFASLSLARVGRSYAGLTYRRNDGEGGAAIVMDVLLASTGERDRDPWVLTEEAGAYGSVDIASDDRGGALVYSLTQGNSRQLWFQLLGTDGRAAPVMSGSLSGGPSDPERIVGPPFSAMDASIAKLAFGYVIAARALPGGDDETARIRVHFTDRSGRLTGPPSDVALASEYGSRTAIEAAIDGRVALAWSDLMEDGTTKLTAAKLPCIGGP